MHIKRNLSFIILAILLVTLSACQGIWATPLAFTPAPTESE